MSNIKNSIEHNIGIIYGSKIGNVFLIDEKYAVTIKHCIDEKEEPIKIVFPKICESERKVEAIVVTQLEEDDEWVLLKLLEEIPVQKITFAAINIYRYMDAEVYGYCSNHMDGRWIKLKSGGGEIVNTNFQSDMLFDAVYDKENDFSGLSGSPILKDGKVIGIVSQETLENNSAVSIHGISVKSSIDFFVQNDIEVENDANKQTYSLEKSMSIGEYRDKITCLSSVVDESSLSHFNDLYIEKLNNIIQMHHRGDVNGAWEELKNCIIQIENDSFVDNKIKAEFYYNIAIWYIKDRGDIAKAQKRYKKAKDLNSDLDGSFFMALKLSKTGEDKNAEELLEPINSVKKLNLYFQICIANMKVQKAYDKYEELNDTIVFNSSTYYLLGAIELLRRNYDRAMEVVNKAIDMDRKVPFFYLLRGIIAYWKAIPQDAYLPDNLFPVIFSNGLFQLDVVQLELIKTAINDYRKAYQLAESVENKEQVEIILSAWINTLSVDYTFQNDILEPLQLLKKNNPYNVILLLYMIQRNMELHEEVTIENLKHHICKCSNKIGHLIVLFKFCLLKDDRKTMKHLLHEYKSLFFQGNFYEYWYEYIIKVEEDKDKLKDYEEEIKNNKELNGIRKKRLQNMFIQLDYEREQELKESLIDLYEQTGNRLDLVNLIYFFRIHRIWGGLLQYAEILSQKFGDIYGEMYKIQGLIGQEDYEEALVVIERLNKKGIVGFEKELLMNQMRAYECLGKYTEAIKAGEILLQKIPSEQLILNLASLYILDGDEDSVLRILLVSEKFNLLTVNICQRISNCYLTRDNQKAWEYAQKAMQLSKNQPEIMLWAASIGNRVGKSTLAGELYHKVMISYPNYESAKSVGIDELLEIIRESHEEFGKRYAMLYKGELPSHLFIDATKGNLTYVEYFYQQWESNNMIPMEFGAHHNYDECLNQKITKIALDYSSCILMNEMGILNILCDIIEQVYVAGDLFGILSEEVRIIPMHQEDLVKEKINLIEKCKNELKLEFVKMEIPNNTEGLGVKQTSNAVSFCTANANNAVWVSYDEDGDLKEYEVIEALYECNKISEDTYLAYQVNENDVRKTAVQKLLNEYPRLLVDEVVLAKWDSFNLLPTIKSCFNILVEENAEQSAMESKAKLEQKERICKKVLSLRENLILLKENGKLSFLPVQEEQKNMKYSQMLETLLIVSEKRNIPVCIDDRVLTSYPTVGKERIYNTFDLLKHLWLFRKISIEKYSEIWNKVIDKNICYVLPDNQVIFYALNLSDVNIQKQMINESQMLKKIRKYIVKALSTQTHLNHDIKPHVQISEKDYFVFNLQINSRELIKLIWQSDMKLIKKRVASEWILSHYSQFAFDFSVKMDKKAYKLNLAIQIADFLIAGILLSCGEQRVEEYYSWLYEWLDIYLDKNAEIKDKVFNYTKEFLLNHLVEGRRNLSRDKILALELMYATGIYHMPEEFKNYILKDNTLSDLYYSIYCEISIVLTQQRQIPVGLYKLWVNEVLILNEGYELIKTFDEIVFKLSWFSIIPGFPGLVIKWKEGERELERRIFLELGIRLRHNQKDVRKNEYNYIVPYLLEDYDEDYLKLLRHNKYTDAANKIVWLLQMSEKYEMQRIEHGIRDYWFKKKNTWNLLLPSEPDFFKKFYNVDDDIKKISNEAIIKIPLQLGTVFDIETSNHNPVRLLHKLAWQLLSNGKEEDILSIISLLFSFYDESNKKYGKIYILFLKSIWKIFNELQNYKKEKLENLIIWTYIWTDMMMTSITQLEIDGIVDIEMYVKQLQKDMDIELDTDGVGEEINEFVLSPKSMNLFRLCVNGTLAICCMYKEKMKPIAKDVLGILNSKGENWIDIPIHFLEKELMYINKNGLFETIFKENIYMLIRNLGEITSSSEIMDSLTKYGCIPNRRQFLLLSMLKLESLTINEIMYLFLLSREKISLEDEALIEVIIEEKILEQESFFDSKCYEILSSIVAQLSEKIKEEYRRTELTKIGEKLKRGELPWNVVEEQVLAIVVTVSIDEYLNFWETYESFLNEDEALQLAERIGWMQPRISFEENERVRELRIRLEMRE